MTQRTTTGLKAFAIAGILFLVAALMIEYLPSTSAVQWHPYAQALEKAKREKKLVYLDVYADWCVPCKEMDRTTFQHDSVIALLNSAVIASRVNIDDVQTGGEIKKKFNIAAMPTSLLLTPNEQEIKRNVGYMHSEKFLEWISDTVMFTVLQWDDFSTAVRRAKESGKPILIFVLHDVRLMPGFQDAFHQKKVRETIHRRFIPTLLYNTEEEHREIIKKYSLLPSKDFIGAAYLFSTAMELKKEIPLRNYDIFRMDAVIDQLAAGSGQSQ